MHPTLPRPASLLLVALPLQASCGCESILHICVARFELPLSSLDRLGAGTAAVRLEYLGAEEPDRDCLLSLDGTQDTGGEVQACWTTVLDEDGRYAGEGPADAGDDAVALDLRFWNGDTTSDLRLTLAGSDETWVIEASPDWELCTEKTRCTSLAYGSTVELTDADLR